MTIAVWWILAITVFHTPSGAPGAVPPPVDVARRIVSDLSSSVYWDALRATGGSALEGYLAGTVIGLLLAFTVLIVPWFEPLSLQLAVVTYCVPMTAVAPVVVMLSPAGSRAVSVLLAALAVIFTTVVGTLLGLRAADPIQLDVVTAYGGSRLTRLLKVQLIAAVPSIIAALKIGAPAAFLGAVVGEYFLIGVNSGAGLLLLSLQQNNDSVGLWAIALICTAVAGTAYFLISCAGRLLAPWSSGESAAGIF